MPRIYDRDFLQENIVVVGAITRSTRRSLLRAYDEGIQSSPTPATKKRISQKWDFFLGHRLVIEPTTQQRSG